MKLLAAFAAGLAGSIALGLCLIPWFRRCRLYPEGRVRGPVNHQAKAGTPILGGFIFILPIIVVTILRPEARYLRPILALAGGFALIGLVDDLLKIRQRPSVGLRPGQKLFWQTAMLFGIWAVPGDAGLGSAVILPWGGLELGSLYPVWALTVLLTSANSVNLADGLDGLAAGTGCILLFGYALILPVIGANPAVVYFVYLIIGALLGFLCFNRPPARVFMGDSGSLALGGIIGSLALMTRTELFLLMAGGVFAIDTLSVILQVAYFRLTRGKRLFRVSPIHHHFEVVGFSEPIIVCGAYVLGSLFTALGVLVYLL